MKNLRISLLLVFIGLAFWSCSVRKNNILSRSYHGTTTHYNFYFNARERMKTAAATLAEAHEDKYDRVLSVFKIGDLNKAKSVFPDLDEAIKKASIAITRHSMVVKGKKDKSIQERNPWIPECYLVVGQSQFYKHDFWTAIETFQYVSSEYKNDPIRPEALIWLTRAYLELGKTTDAEYLIDYLKADKKFPVKLTGFYNAVVAQYHLQKNDIPRAMDALQKAAATSKKKDDRSRYYFILAQLYQKTDSTEKAFSAYEKVIKLNPNYEMAFNARINRARCYDVSSGNASIVKRELNKMLKDEKNKEFRDQIYYALAGVAIQEKDEPLSIDYLNKSIRESSSNNTQKALSYKELGNIYLKRPEYIPAAAYYDSCLTNLNNEHPDYIDIQAKRNSLDRLVKNLKVIMTEDSLQHLAAMSPAEREASIGKLVEAEDAEKARLKAAQEEQQRLEELEIQEEKDLKSQPRSNIQPGSAAQGAWYFYNQSAISFGFSEFQKRWGTRKNEDNWRRSEKEISMGDVVDTATVDSSAGKQQNLNDSIAKLDSKARKEAYLAQIPNSPEQIRESNLKIAEAYYNCGVIYREQLNNFKESINSFETLDKRYPDNKYKQPSYYNLYRTYLQIGDTAKSDFYKNYILTNFPESDYARLILNPNFFKELKRKSEVMEVYYENTYRAYLNRQYDKVIERTLEASNDFPADNKLTPKFAYLKALAIGKTRAITDFQFELEDVIRRYPKDSVSFRAKEILDYIKGNNVQATAIDTTPVDTVNMVDPFAKSAKYVFDMKASQFFMILYPKGVLNPDELINKIRSFDNLEFSEQNLQVMKGNIDLTIQYIAVMSFPTKDDAMTYYQTIVAEDNLLSEFDPQQVNYFIISQENLTELTRTKDIKAYTAFFRTKYLE
ncbi:MAG: tetratricopeptide repeat protein [Bacteroidia bacterium]